MKLVFDSNVLVAAFATHGVCYEIFEHCLRNDVIICSDFIAEEVERILTHKIKTPPKTVQEIIRYLKNHAEWVIPEKKIFKGLRDSNDQIVLGTAFAGEVNYLITGDKDLLVLKEVKKIVIISPRDFWIFCQKDGLSS